MSQKHNLINKIRIKNQPRRLNFLNAELFVESNKLNTESSQNIGEENVLLLPKTNSNSEKEKETITVISPTKEIQTIHTVTNNTNTVIADQDLRDTVNRILRQLNSDRPDFSLGQVFDLPDNLRGRTLGIGDTSDYNDFTVDKNGNVQARTLITTGEVIVQGNFRVNGAQTFSGASVLSAATEGPLFAIDQTGNGAALRADNILFKGYKIDFSGLGSIEIDDNGYLVLAAKSGKIKGAVGQHFLYRRRTSNKCRGRTDFTGFNADFWL